MRAQSGALRAQTKISGKLLPEFSCFSFRPPPAVADCARGVAVLHCRNKEFASLMLFSDSHPLPPPTWEGVPHCFGFSSYEGAVRRALRANENIGKTPAEVFLLFSFRQPSTAAAAPSRCREGGNYALFTSRRSSTCPHSLCAGPRGPYGFRVRRSIRHRWS